MNSSFYHIQFNVKLKENREFYRTMLNTLQWNQIYDTEDMLSFADDNGTSFWFINSDKNGMNDYDDLGVNHIGINVKQQSDVDDFIKAMERHNIEPLFGTPRHRPEFSASKNETYYQVMFKSPDNILFEVVYVGIK